jgi:uncharacterized protein (DUF1499 family)
MPPPKPSHLGLTDGKLGGCPSSPNCVSSESSDAAHRVVPIAFTGPVADAREQLIHIVGQLPRTRLVTEQENYLHFECRSKIFRFIDDLEFYIDAKTKSIQMRSASRIGYSDLGVNRDRVNKITEAFQYKGE